MVARKDFNIPKHHTLDVRNLYVIKAMQSLASRGYVRTNFSWMWYYYFLTDEGIDYIRDYTGVDADLQPKTRQKTSRRTFAQRPTVRMGEDNSSYSSDSRKMNRAPDYYEPHYV